MNQNKIKVAVIGHGHLGKWHCEKAAYLDACELVAIVEPSSEQQSKAKLAHPNAQVVSRVEEILDLIDAAIVVTPTSTHFSLIEILVKANKHVFCEKPLCSHEEEMDQIRKLAQGKDIVLQVGHSERFHQAWNIINSNPDYKRYLESIGTLRISRMGPFKGRATDVDVVQDLMVHDIDLLLFLFDDHPCQVSSTGYKIRTQKWDYVCSEFEFVSGRRAIVTVGRNHVKEIRELEYTGPLGCMYIDMFTNEVLIAPKDLVSPERKKLSEYVEVLSYDRQDHLLIEQEYFYESILNHHPAVVTFEDGMKAVHLISCVLESLETQKTVRI